MIRVFVFQALMLAGVVVPVAPFFGLRQPYRARHRLGFATGSSAQCGRVLL
jgi:hypothetical protein